MFSLPYAIMWNQDKHDSKHRTNTVSQKQTTKQPNTKLHQAKVSKHNSKQPNTEHMHTCIFGPLAMAHSVWSQSNHHMRSVSFYHTIAHDNDSMNEMPKVHTGGVVLDDSGERDVPSVNCLGASIPGGSSL